MNNVNVTFIVIGLGSGGIENYLLRFLNEYYQNFDSIYIYCKGGKGGQLENEYLLIPNLKIIKSEIGYLDYKGLKKLKNFYYKEKINVVCDFTGNFSGLTLFTAKRVGIKKRVAFYRSSTDRFKNDVFRDIYNKSMNLLVRKFATDILSNSKTALNNYFSGVWTSDNRFEVIYNGVNAESFTLQKDDLRDELNIPKDAFVIGHTGRFNPAKNHLAIINVAEILTKKYNDIYFIMCGNGVKENLHNEVKNRRLLDRIFLFENRRDIPRFLNTMDCYFFPSVTEGQPNALIEAMIMGLPYVASNINPIKETVLDDRNLYDPNDIQSFSKSLEHIYKKRSGRDLKLQQQAIKRFDSRKLFKFFYNRLAN